MFFLVGPTSAGKSEIAVSVARACEAEIVSADAFQIYAGLPLLTAQPDASLREQAPHHLIGEIPLGQPFDAARYRELALARIREIETRGKRVLVVGGTGLYVRALTHGLAKLPGADPALRAELNALSLEELQGRYAALDPRGMEKIDRQNPRRLIRAIEVSLLTGIPFSRLRGDWSESGPERAQAVQGALLLRPPEDLHARIASRVDQMFQAGVVEEVCQAGEAGPTARQAIGYAEIRAHLSGEMDRASCIAAIKLKTRQYSKRQLTWFRRESSFIPTPLTSPSHSELVPGLVRRILSGAA